MIVATDIPDPKGKLQVIEVRENEGCLGPLLLMLAVFFTGFACGYYVQYLQEVLR